jgi:hypothetical protein
MAPWLRAIAEWTIRLPAAAFFAFVGYWKAFGPYEALAEHHAWVAGFPAWFARGVGVSEMLCALALLVPAKPGSTGRLVAGAALLLIANQIAALAVHASRGESAALPQNVVIIALLCLLFVLLRMGERK